MSSDKNKLNGLSAFDQAAIKALKRIPRGQVATYGEIAAFIGRPGAARAVGNALHKNPYAPFFPCHRVVRSDGRVGGFAQGQKKKIGRLKAEGINIKNGKVANFEAVLVKF